LRILKQPKPRALTGEEQAAMREERISREAESGVRRAARLLDEGADEDRAIRALQAKLGLTPFKDHIDAKPLVAVVDVLNKNLQRIRDELALISVERLLSGEMGFAGVSMPTGPRLKEVETKRDALRAKLRVVTPDPAPPKAGELPASIREALTVFDSDEPVKFTPTRISRQLELQTKQEVVEAGLRDAMDMVRALRDEIGDGQNRLAQKAHSALHVQLFRALQVVSEIAEQERAVRSAVAACGYVVRTDICPAPAVLSALLLLGSELDYQSQISQFRRLLQTRGILK
jgi:hypothetical protein